MDVVDIDKKISVIKADKLRCARDKITELNNWINLLPDRKPTHKGNVTMKQYLSQLKINVEKDPIKYADDEIKKLEQAKLNTLDDFPLMEKT